MKLIQSTHLTQIPSRSKEKNRIIENRVNGNRVSENRVSKNCVSGGMWIQLILGPTSNIGNQTNQMQPVKSQESMLF